MISAIKRFGICAHRFRRRTQRRGRRKQHAIKVIDTGLRTSTCSYTRMDRRNLINVHSISNSTKTLCGLRVGCFSAQPVQRSCDKGTEISTFICDQHIDIPFITETWLKPHGDEGRLHDLTPAGYMAKSFPRESRGGGIALVYNKCLSNLIFIIATFSFHHQSFEVIRLSITLTSGNIIFFCLYRPSPSRNNQLTDSSFFSEFSFLLDQCNTLSSKSIILEHLNVHFDIPTNRLVLKINSLLNRYSFYEAVTAPTTKFGHTLDIACLDVMMTLYVPLLLPSDFHLIITVLSVTFLQSNLLTMLNSNSQDIYVA